jgi:hypothetical protein
MRMFCALVLMVAACAADPEQIEQGATCQTCPPPESGSPACPAVGANPIQWVGIKWPKVIGWNNAVPAQQVVFASPTNGFTCGSEASNPNVDFNSPRPWQYPLPATVPPTRRYPVCALCAGGWESYQFFPTENKTYSGTYAQSAAQSCSKACTGGNGCESYQRQDLAWQCNIYSPACHTW